MHALVITPASSGFRYVEAAHELDMRVSVITPQTGEYRLPEQVHKAADHVQAVDSTDATRILDAARAAHRLHPVHAVVAGDEFSVPTTALVARELGLPALAENDAPAVRDKGLMRARLHHENVPAPTFAVVHDAQQAARAADEIGYPCVVKPTDMVGTIGVRRVDDRDGAVQAYRAIAREQLPLNGVLPTGTALVESYLDGPEYSADGYVEAGRAHLVGINRKFLGPEPHFQQNGYLVRPAVAVDGHEQVDAYIQRVAAALGITTGPFHAEYRVTSSGPVLLEVGARLAGDHIVEMTEMVTGVCLARAALATAVELPVPAPRRPEAAVAGLHFVTAPELVGRTYRELHGWKETVARGDVHSAGVDLPAGTPIPDRQDLRSRIAHLVFTADTFDHALAVRAELASAISVLG